MFSIFFETFFLQMTEVKAYFFIIDFLHLKKSNDETDLLMDSIVYFYPDKDEIKKQVNQ